MGFDWSWLKKPQEYGDGKGTALGRMLTAQEVHENFLSTVIESRKIAWEIGDIRPWNKSASALATMSICTGTAGATVVPGTERRIGVTLASTAHYDAVQVGDIITNDATRFSALRLGGPAHWATVVGKRATPPVVYVDINIFALGTPYAVYRPIVPTGWMELTGPLRNAHYALTPGRTVTAVATDKLIDAGGDFVNRGVAVGNWTYNAQTGTSAMVTAIDSATQLSVSWHAFAATGGAYSIYAADIEIPRGLYAGQRIMELNRGAVYIGGGPTAGVSETDWLQWHRHFHPNVVATFVDVVDGTGQFGVNISGGSFHGAWPPEVHAEFGNGVPRAAHRTQPRTLRMPYIMMID